MPLGPADRLRRKLAHAPESDAYMNTRTVFVAARARIGLETRHFTSLSFYPRRVHPSRCPRRVCLRRARLGRVRPAAMALDRLDTESAAPPAQRRTVSTQVVLCVACGAEEVLGYAVSKERGYVCMSCEDRAILAAERRRSVLQWWPIVLILILLGLAGAGLSWALADNRAPHDPVTPGEH
jgi:hypothetical protein